MRVDFLEKEMMLAWRGGKEERTAEEKVDVGDSGGDGDGPGYQADNSPVNNPSTLMSKVA